MNDTWFTHYRTSVLQGLRALSGRGRSGGHVRELDGLRALACMWVIALHTISNLGSFWVTEDRDVRILDKETFLDVERNPAIRWMVKGDLGVDMFFVLSGFLIARGLFKELQRQGTIGISEFYVRRWLRLYPVFAFAVVAYAVIESENLANAWPTLFYVSNFVPALNQFMLHAWSLAVEWQFYVLFPWLVLLLHWMRCLTPWTLSGLVVGCIGLRALTLDYYGLHIGLAGHPAIDTEAAQRFNTLFYDELHVRFGGLLCGVVLAACAERGAIRPFFERRPVQSWLWFLLLALLTLGIVAPSPVPEPGVEPNETVIFVFLALYQIVFAAFIAYLMAFMQSETGFGRLMRKTLSARWLSPLAQLSYGAYLMHPLVIKLTYEAGFVPSTDSWQLTAYGFGFMAAAFLVAVPVFVFVEFPLMHIRRAPVRALAPTPAT